MSNNTDAFIQLALYIVATSTVTGTHTLMYARLVKVFLINLEKDEVLCYMQKIATMFEVHHRVLQNSFNFCWSHQHTFAGHTNTHISVCECATNKAYKNH